MILDPVSILLTSTAVALILTGMMAYYKWTRKVYAGFTHWLWGDILVTVSFFLIAFQGVLPDFISILIGNILLILSLVVLYQGIRRFFGEFSQDKPNLSVLAIFSVVFGYFVYIDVSSPMRIAISSFTLCFLMYRAGLLLFKAPAGLKSSAVPGGVMMWVTGAFFFARAVNAIINFSTLNLLSTSLFNNLGFMMGAVLVSTWTFGFFFLNSARMEFELNTVQDELQKLVLTDVLTGIYNRRYFFEHGDLEFQRARRYQGSFSVLVADADHFKNINDQYGHAAGDKALQEIACVISDNMRTSDTCARLGGEEFGILLLETDKEKAIDTAERIREQMEQKIISFDERQFSVTVSVGVAVLEEEDQSVADVLHRADQALYRAKEKARNRVSD